MENLSVAKFEKNDLETQLKAANEALELLHINSSRWVGDRLQFDPGAIEKITGLQQKIKEIEAELQKCDKAIEDSNRSLEATKAHYGEIAAAAERSSAGQLEDPRLRQLSEDAQAANNRLTELSETLAELEERNARLGLAIGKAAQAERADLTDQIEAVNQEMVDCEAHLDELAENGALGQLACGAQIAEERIADLSQYLADLQEKQRKLGLATIVWIWESWQSVIKCVASAAMQNLIVFLRKMR